MFDEDGNLLRRLGREGQGPGEFQRIGLLWVDQQNRLHVFDRRLLRVSIFSPSLDFLGMLTTPGSPVAFLEGPGDTLLLQIPRGSGQYAGFPILQVSPGGDVVRAFGARNTSYRYDRAPYLYMRAIAHSGHGTVWSAWFTKYEIELWDVETGKLLQTLSREAPWFPEWEEFRNTDPPHLSGIAQDTEGRIWTLSIILNRGGVQELSEDPDVPNWWHIKREEIRPVRFVPGHVVVQLVVFHGYG